MVGRIFVGVDLPADTRAALAAGIDGWLAGRRLPGKAVPPPNWHLTFRFLGEIDDTAYDRLLMALDQADLGERFATKVEGFGAFPNARRATVTWLGIMAEHDALARLAAAVDEACFDAGFERDDRPFKGHLTISRVRPPQDVGGSAGGPPPVSFMVEQVTVFRSHLDGATWYERLEAFPLR